MASGPVAGDRAREKHMNRKNPKKLRESAIDGELRVRPWKNQASPATPAFDRASPQFLGAADSNGSSDRSDFPLAASSGLRGYTVFENRVRISLRLCSKIDIRELKRRLTSELDRVRSLAKKLESTANELTGGGAHSQFSSNYSAAASEITEKRPMKRPKAVNRGRGEVMFGQSKDKFESQFFRSCCNLLEKLMKHKFGWVFNTPVNARSLGLLDYHKIIKRPMDLGTVKAKLNKAQYRSAEEFADDVRLTFGNAILYNPKGQDVHSMAEKLLAIFEEKWSLIEANYGLKKSVGSGDDIDFNDCENDEADPAVLSTRKAQSFPAPVSTPPMAAPPAMRTLDRSESVTKPLGPDVAKRLPIEKKPKAMEAEKRDMTYEEKQRLSTSLQNLPSEKLDNVVQIIKKRNLGLSQQDDEIEVDIASVDPETLWELDRFVTNYVKSLAKNKRKAENALNNTRQQNSQTVSETEGCSGNGSDSRS